MLNFEIAARTLLHLGSELITSDEVALYELIKNSFDANSPRVSIKIFNPVPKETIKECEKIIISYSKEKPFENLKLLILKTLFRDWLLRENNQEKIDFDKYTNEIKAARNITSLKKKCLSLNHIEIIDSGDGMDEKNLITSFLTIGTSFKKTNDSKGDGSSVLGNKGIGRLSMMRLGNTSSIETWNVKSDYINRIDFNWEEFDSPELLLNQIKFPLHKRDKKSSEKGTRITISSLHSDWPIDKIDNEIVNGFLRRLNNPFETENRRFPVDLFYNNGKRIAIKPIDSRLLKLADRELVLNFSPNEVRKDSDEILKTKISIPGKENSTTPQSRTLRDLTHKFGCTLDMLKELGPFKLTINWFNRAKLAKKGLGSDLKKFRNELDLWNGGIAIYRDGFRIGLSGSTKDGDWLNIDNMALRGRGLTLNRIQTVGVLEITKKNNPRLIDRSNREGLIDNESIALLIKIIKAFAIEELRSHANSEETIQKKELEVELLSDGVGSIELRLSESEKIIHEIQEISPETKNHVVSLHQNIQFIANNVRKFQSAIDELKERREDILELAGVGNVMRSIMHELTRTTGQTRLLLGKVAKKADNETAELLHKLEAEIKSLNVRLSQLDPLSTTGRNRKGDFELIGLVKTIINGYKSRFARHDIDFSLTIDTKPIKSEKMMVKMVKGFVSLTIENLILNSIYWLKTGYLVPGEVKAKISINIDTTANVIELYDNGPGISPTDKNRIFNPGFTLRKDGRGYGLYIAKEVSANYSSNIYLSDHEFADNRLRMFVIELPKDNKNEL